VKAKTAGDPALPVLEFIWALFSVRDVASIRPRAGYTPDRMEIELLRADVNSLKVDAIINPASASKPVAEFGSVPVGHAVVTSGGNVLCKFVIHAIVPRFGDGDEDAKLRNAVWAALKRAEELAIASVAMPPVPAVFGFDPTSCWRVLVSTALDFRPHARSLQRVVFCAFSEQNYGELRLVLEELTG
jgi:O-acetyl-ADP-ribose deacetylase (regulator of RNase III)